MSVEMFRGQGIGRIGDLVSGQRGEEVGNSIEEIRMATKGTYHSLAQAPDKPDALALLITDRKADLGSGWSALRSAFQLVAPACPSCGCVEVEHAFPPRFR